ncbi:hypothetical protein [Amycolatopsis anabasis]|uniref:hypothetical protein n=1 Tax=Amycolatopsis anabasis TaxID=1840409 RepID=UPI001C554A12|nr:hypothetical protein [Amycolatopsis anabasis]
MDLSDWRDARDLEDAVIHLEHAQFYAQAASLKSLFDNPARLDLVLEILSIVSTGFADALLVRWVTPPDGREKVHGITEFSPWEFVAGFDGRCPTVYVMNAATEGGAAAIAAALVDEVVNVTVQAAALSAGRLDPPVTIWNEHWISQDSHGAR